MVFHKKNSFFNTIITNDGNDKHIFNTLCTNLSISYIITTVCLSVRPTTVPHLNGPAELVRTVGFRKWESAQTVEFQKG